MFDGFALERLGVGGVVLRVRHGGSGPPVLLHGHPRTHATWHRVAPLLAGDHTVVCPDLRGYGGSSKPPTTPDHRPYSKRAMAGDCLELMRRLGHERFALVGHDRGGYVAFRLALDHPDAWYGGDPEQMGEEAFADYRRAIHDPATVHAMREDYRARPPGGLRPPPVRGGARGARRRAARLPRRVSCWPAARARQGRARTARNMAVSSGWAGGSTRWNQ